MTSNKASQIRLLILDVDGVLTDGGLLFDSHGVEYKIFNSLDGHGIRMLLDSAIEVAIITGRKSTIVTNRAQELGVKYLYQGCNDKLVAFNELLQKTSIESEQVAYMGDDLPDLPVLRRAGLAITVQNAHSFVKRHCDWVTTLPGGRGAVREVTDAILQAQGLLDARQNRYLE